MVGLGHHRDDALHLALQGEALAGGDQQAVALTESLDVLSG